MRLFRHTNQRFFSKIFLLAPLLVMALSPMSRCEEVDLTLKSGTRLKADLLKRSEDRLVLDLGFHVLTVPVSEVLSENAEEEDPAAAPAVDAAAPADSASTNRRRREGSFQEILSDLEKAVVVVSNPHGFGAGFIIDASGLLLTNHHVVRGEKFNDVTLFLNGKGDKKEKKVFRKVEVKGYSTLFDCALLKIPEKELEGIELETLDLAPPEALKSGVRVYAIGNPGVGMKMLRHSVSQGILSSTNRNFDDILYLQTTAAINPGNSGGPLLNSRGEVLGLVTFKAVFQEGLAFALPATYLGHFLANAEAYAPGSDDKNVGYRYHDPSEWRRENEALEKEDKE